MTTASDDGNAASTASEAAGLATAVLDAEAEREAQQESAQKEVLFANDLLPGVGEEEISLRKAVGIGGTSTFVVLLLLRSFEELESATLSVLAPDLRKAFGVEQRRDRLSPPRHRARSSCSARSRWDGWPTAIAGHPSSAGRAWCSRVSSPRAVRSPMAVPDVLGEARRRHRQVELHPGARFAHRRRVPDQRPRPSEPGVGHGRTVGRRARAR